LLRPVIGFFPYSPTLKDDFLPQKKKIHKILKVGKLEIYVFSALFVPSQDVEFGWMCL
jgi:hypothetical protein